METSLASGRDILLGVAKYVREHQPWALFHEPRSLEETPPTWLRNWSGQGIIARVQNRQIADLVKSTGLPVVDVLGLVPDAGIPLVHVDDHEIARLAAEHLWERGFRHFGYFGLRGENWSVRRRDSFRDWLRAMGAKLSVHEQTRHEAARDAWEKREDELAAWIKSLPKPAGVMVCSDQRGLDFLEACRRAGVTVPDEVAVIGVDNDEALCEIGFPPLSSVWPAHTQVGYAAAELLDHLLAGGNAPAKPTLIDPSGIKIRQSSEVLAIKDRNIATAIQAVRERACDGLKVDEVAELAGLSRTVLQRRFRKLLGKTVHRALLDTRIKRACQLLMESDLTLVDVAEQAGFKHQEYLGAVFQSRFGKTPAQYRRETAKPKW